MVALALVAGLTGGAQAADAVQEGAVQEVVVVDDAFDWSGVYVGLDAGYATGNSDIFVARTNFSLRI